MKMHDQISLTVQSFAYIAQFQKFETIPRFSDDPFKTAIRPIAASKFPFKMVIQHTIPRGAYFEIFV